MANEIAFFAAFKRTIGA